MRDLGEGRAINRLETLLGELEQLVIRSIKIPLTTKTLVDEDKLIDLLEEVRAQLPEQIKRADELLSQRDALIADAQRQVEQLITEGQRRAQQLVEETEVYRQAVAEADRLRAEVHQALARQQQEADRYAEQVLSELELKIARTLSTIQNGRAALKP